MKSTLSKYKDTDLLILDKLNDKDLLAICQVNKYMKDLCNDDNFWRNRFESKFGKHVAEKKNDERWKEYYFQLLKIRNKYNNSKFHIKWKIFTENIKKERLDILKFLNDFSVIDQVIGGRYPLEFAINRKNIDIVKYLVENGASLNQMYIVAQAAGQGHLDIVKYLVEKGADIHEDNEYALQLASARGHLDVVKYLVKKGANIHTDNDLALREARKNNWTKVVEYLESLQ